MPPAAPHESFFRVWVPTLVVALFIITFIAQPFDIPSDSMEKTLLVGDHLLADRVRYGPPAGGVDGWADCLLPYRAPQHDDIVVFMSVPEDIPGLHLVKRLIGVPGDRIHLVHGAVVRNGVALNQPYAWHGGSYEPARDEWPNGGTLDGTLPGWQAAHGQYIQNGDLVVPPGQYFVMGDNRDDSLDSRYWGFVPAANMIGRPSIVYWSYQATGDSGTDTDGPLTTLLHAPFRTRYSRSLHIVR